MRGLDLSSWQGILSSLIGLSLVTLIGIGIRLIAMYTIQQRRERANRQINERLRVLIAAYKALGGSFTGDLTVDPTHLRELRRRASLHADGVDSTPTLPSPDANELGSDRTRRMRDAAEAALSDIFLLGTDEQVRLAARAARELTAGQPVHTHELVVSLRNFIREALDLAPIPPDVQIPMQGPARPSSSGGGKGKGEGGKGEEGRQGGGNRGGGAGGAGGGGLHSNVGLDAASEEQDRI